MYKKIALLSFFCQFCHFLVKCLSKCWFACLGSG